MSIVAVRAALETALNSMSPSLPTAWENISFTPPATAPYQRMWLIGFPTENPTVGPGYHRIHSYAQIDLMCPLEGGTADIGARADLVAKTFKRGASFVANGITVQIETDPMVGAGAPDGDRYKVIIKFRYFADIFS